MPQIYKQTAVKAQETHAETLGFDFEITCQSALSIKDFLLII